MRVQQQIRREGLGQDCRFGEGAHGLDRRLCGYRRIGEYAV